MFTSKIRKDNFLIFYIYINLYSSEFEHYFDTLRELNLFKPIKMIKDMIKSSL